MRMFVRAPSALWTELDGQTLFMNIEDGSYFEVVGIGNVIWNLLDIPRSEAEVVDYVTARYRVDRNTCVCDVRDFLERLLGANLITEEVASLTDAGNFSGG
jgi:hypothetical protein